MIPITAKIIQRPPLVDKIVSNIAFGTAKGLTKTAQEGQTAVVGALKGNFTLRGSWFEKNQKFGIKIKPATKTDQSAEVRTMADWLVPHEEGKDKHARSGRVAVPTENVRRNKKMIIPKGQRPKGLAGKTFVLKTRRGDVLAQRLQRGKRKGLIVLYGLENSVKIKKVPIFYTPIKRVMDRRLVGNIRDGIDSALRTMR